MAAVAAGCRKALINARWATVLLSCTNGSKNSSFPLVGAPFLTFLGSFQSGAALSGRRTLTIECLLMSARGCGQSHKLVMDTLKKLWLTFPGLSHSRSENTGETV